MAIVKAKQGFFVTWSKADDTNPNVERFLFDSEACEKWSKIQTNLCYFYKKYIIPCLLGQMSIKFCVICDKHCLWEDELDDRRLEDRSVQCSSCSQWYHHKCLLMDEIPGSNLVCVACEPAEESDFEENN